MYTNIIYIALNYRCTLYIKVAYTNYLTGSLNIYINKTPFPNFGTLFSHLFIDRKLYYNNSLFLNKSML